MRSSVRERTTLQRDSTKARSMLPLKTILNSGREQVFYTVWRKYPDHDFSFLGPDVVKVIEDFKAKLAEEATPITEVPVEEAQQQGEEEVERMEDDQGREQ